MADAPNSGPQVVIDGETVEIDPKKWMSPATKGELFHLLQHVRALAFMNVTHTAQRSMGDVKGATETHKKMVETDKKLMDVLIKSIAVEKADG